MTSATVHATARRARLVCGLALASLSLAACATAPDRLSGPTGSNGAPYKVGKPYQVKGRWYTPAEQPRYNEVGLASWYGEQFHNRRTANGEVFDMDRISAAHKTLPLPCLVEVTNLDNGKTAIIRINDRGPFVDGRIIDLSKAAAQELGYQRQGVARVRVRYVGPAPAGGMGARSYRASAPVQPVAPRQPPLTVAAAQSAQTGPYDRYAGTPFAAAASATVIITPQPAPPMTAGGPDYLPDIRPPPRTFPRAAEAAVDDGGGGYRIQAGAFADRNRAEAAVRTLSGTGRAEIVEVERGGATLYRVQVTGQGQAWTARDRVASLGYSDAKVIEGR